ncbi:hypothetical protein F5Y16DRAFT_258939 [Xylariaceae sp. FL0255]|nr:hypothetical protein F5Y16DRAFT_258939 [Xylariaceae sp. FL0255]
MPSFEREAPDRHLRHQHSASSSNALVPMWDSSDPDRAPPPLPLNPQSPSMGTSRAGTSLAIQSAHAALHEKARENALVPTLNKRSTMTDFSPERALVQRPSPHKRMQSLQPGNVRDMSLMLEGSRDSVPRTLSPEKLSRPATPGRRDTDKSTDKENTPTPMSTSLTPVLRPAARRPNHSILGENTPPQSATMLALQNMSSSSSSVREVESPLATVTNNSAAGPKTSGPTPVLNEQLTSQLLNLTNIASSLQKEMAALSRRSRDNATDLMSLKEATHARDEDIRKSLRELALNVDTTRSSRDGGLYLDNKAYNTSPTLKHARPFALPRIPSPNSFVAESDLSVPSLIGGERETPATMALLEKIIREMGTKDGHDAMMDRLTELVERLGGMASAAKVQEVLDLVKMTSQEHSIVPAAGNGGNQGRTRSFDSTMDPNSRELEWSQRTGSMTSRVERLLQENNGNLRSSVPSRSGEVLNDDIIKVIRSVKDSVAAGGGLTAEVKALVRELRGEVLGMGRELGRKLEESGAGGKTSHSSKSESGNRAELVKIVEESLEQMKVYMAQRLREHRRESTESTKSVVDYQEIYNAVRSAISDNEEAQKRDPQLSRDDVLNAVRDAWENYKPEIEIQQLGLERDEVLACIKEGLDEFAPRQEIPEAATRDEVFEAVVKGMKHFNPPKIETPATLSRNEILEAVRECLEEFEFPVAPSAIGNDLTRDDMLHAVKEGLGSFEFPNPNAALVPHDGSNGVIMERLHDIMHYMREEFKAVSEEAKQNVAANGRDTEQVLDATKDGFENLRLQIEEYVDRAAGNTNNSGQQEEIMANLVNSFDNFRDDLTEMIAKTSDNSRDLVKQEIEALRDTVNSSLVPHVPPQNDNREAFEAIRESLDRIRGDLLRPHAGTTDILDALDSGFSDMRAFIERMNDKPGDLTANDEILEALKSGLDGVHSDIENLRENTHDNERAVTLSAPPSDALIPTDLVKHDDIKNLEVLMTQVRLKMEEMETAQPAATAPTEGGGLSKEDLIEMEDMLRNGVSKDDLSEMEDILRKGVSQDDLGEIKEMLHNIQETMASLSKKPEDGEETPVNLEDAATKEDALAIETILRNTKARVDDLIDDEQAVRKDHIDAVEAIVLETKESLGTITGQLDSITRKEDLVAIESLVTQVNVALDEMKERAEKSLEDPEKVTKTDVDAIEAVVFNIKSLLEEMSGGSLANVPTKDDLKALEVIVNEIKEYNTAQAEANATVLSHRQTEVLTVNEKVDEIKAFLEEFQSLAKEKLESGGNGVETLGRLLTDLSETINKNATVGNDVREMFELMKTEFEESRNGVVGAKLDTDEKMKETADTLSEKIDEKIGELITRYDEFQLVMEDRTKAGEARDADMEAAVIGNKAVTEELKVLIDTLGSTVTESLERMEEASKTVFEKVDVLYGKTEENHSDGMNEHKTTQEHVLKAIDAIEGLQGNVSDYHPKIFDAVKDVLLIVGEHYEHSKNSTTDLQKCIEDAKPEELALPPPPEKYDDTEVQSKLDKLDTEVHSKLDKLVDHTHTAGKAYAQLDTLDKVHQQVVQTAADISDFLASQKQRIENEYEDREKTLQETNIALERQRAEQEHVTANVAMLREEEAQLRESILSLRTEQEFLTRQKTRMTADVSSLETALHLRREELHAMDVRAEGLERRILEGVLDHSRALLMTKSSTKGRDAMSRKRVARSSLGGDQLSSQQQTPPSKPSPKPRGVLNMAVSGNRASLIPPNPAGASRRILSLSQITNNVPTGGLKRSQSVRAPAAAALRKSSWAPGRDSAKGYGDLDKENVREIDEDEPEHVDAVVPYPLDDDDAPTPTPVPIDIPTPVGEEEEEDPTVTDVVTLGHKFDDEDLADPEEEQEQERDREGEEGSETGTLRRSSLGTTVITSTETELESASGYSGDEHEHEHDHYVDDDEAMSEWTESAVSGESGESGSIVSGSGISGGDDSFVSESIADTDSIAGEGEIVVYAA